MLSRPWLIGVCVAYTAVCLVQLRCAPARRTEVVLTAEPLEPQDALADVSVDGGPPVRRGIPPKPAEWQKRPPCDADMGEEAINGACFVALKKRPPCGRLPELNGVCYRAIAKAQREPSSFQR